MTHPYCTYQYYLDQGGFLYRSSIPGGCLLAWDPTDGFTIKQEPYKPKEISKEEAFLYIMENE